MFHYMSLPAHSAQGNGTLRLESRFRSLKTYQIYQVLLEYVKYNNLIIEIECRKLDKPRV